MVPSKPEMGILKLGWIHSGHPFGPRMGPSRPGIDPFRLGAGPLRLTKSFFYNSGPFEKMVGQIRLVFDFFFGGGGYLRAPELRPPNENPATVPTDVLCRYAAREGNRAQVPPYCISMNLKGSF